MSKITKLLLVLTGKAKLSDVWHFCVGNYRYKLFYSTKKWKRNLLREHIKEQIEYRIIWMDKQCYDQGSCKICGCETTALQMANKACDKPCYPPMLSKKEWDNFIARRSGIFEGILWRVGTDKITGKKLIQ